MRGSARNPSGFWRTVVVVEGGGMRARNDDVLPRGAVRYVTDFDGGDPVARGNGRKRRQINFAVPTPSFYLSFAVSSTNGERVADVSPKISMSSHVAYVAPESRSENGKSAIGRTAVENGTSARQKAANHTAGWTPQYRTIYW